MTKIYRIQCKLCGNIHFPIFGKREIYTTGILPSSVMYFTYTCPDNGKSGEVSYPYDVDVDGRSITGWKKSNE